MAIKIDTQKFKESLAINLVIVGVIIFLFFTIASINYLTMHVSSEYKTVLYASALTDYVKDNNLTLPMPNANDYVSDGLFDSKSNLYMDKFTQDFNNFTYFLQDNYRYNETTYNCKYWSYVWTLYWKENKDRYDWKMKYIDTPNHIFVMFYNESGYVIADGNTVVIFMEE